MLNVIEVIGILFSAFALSRVVLRAKDKKLTISEFFFWTLIWVGLLGVVFFPGLIVRIANIFGIARGTDLIVYGSVAILFYLIFRLYIKLEEVEQNITKIVREQALSKKKR